MTKVEIAKLALRGSLDARTLVREGRMDRAMAWTALEGARRYLEAIAEGDVADDAEIERRLEVCRACDAPTPLPSVPGARIGYCGPAFVDLTHDRVPVESRTCGCLLAGKAAVRSERCPRGRWGQ